jgi:hypothetical protein
MATIGQALTAPESGWQRYNGNSPKFYSYGGTWYVTTDAGAWAGDLKYNGSNGGTMKFRFKGTKIRLIVNARTGANSSNSVDIVIDGLTENISTTATVNTPQCLAYEKLGLADTVHTVVMTNKTSSNFYVDAIDIDDAGYITHHALNQVLVANVTTMQIGDCIACRYTATTSNVPGTFSEFGTCNAEAIPAAVPLATSDGLFYFIMSGYDSKGRMKLIADRPLQTSVSWDTLNTAGFCGLEGVDKDLGLGVFYRTSIRIPTGGLGPTDPSEWTNIIANCTMGSKITAGDVAIWHWDYSSNWCITSYGTNYRACRGSNSAVTHGSIATTSGSGFRPVLLIEPLNPAPVLNAPTKTIVNPQQVQVSATSVEDLLGETVRYKVEIKKPDNSTVLIRDYDAELQVSPFTFQTLTFTATDFGYGVNTITITMKDQNGFWSTWQTTVTKSLTKKTLIQDGNKWLYINGSDLSTALADYTAATATDKENAFLSSGMGLTLAPTNAMLSQITSDTFNLVFYKRITLT